MTDSYVYAGMGLDDATVALMVAESQSESWPHPDFTSPKPVWVEEAEIAEQRRDRGRRPALGLTRRSIWVGPDGNHLPVDLRR